MPALNAERHFENGHCNLSDQRRTGAGGLGGGKVERTSVKENDRPERPEKPERRPNSKELIEKQRNWTSHFSKTRPNRYNSDPNRSLVQTSLNSQNSTQNATQQQQQTSVDTTCQSSATTSATNDTASPATRSASFCSARSPPPPPPPIRNSSAAGNRRERPASIAVNPSDLPESPEYATIERFDDISPTIPEYAVVQKIRKPQESSRKSQDDSSDRIQDATLPEYAVVQKGNLSKLISRPTDGPKETSKTITQNFKSPAAPTEGEPACNIMVSRSAESSKEISRTIIQNSKGPAVVEGTPGCKSAILRPMDNSKETLKDTSVAVEEAAGLKIAISKPTESSKEAVENTKEISKGPAVEVADSRTVVASDYNDLSQTKAALTHCEFSNPTRSNASMDNVIQLSRRESDLLEAPEYLNCPPSPIHSPAKTSEWRNEWLAKNEEILKRTVDLRDLKSSSRDAIEAEMMRSEVTRSDPRPDWARPSVNAKRKELVDDKKTEVIRSPESELGLPSSTGTDSASSSMSSPSSPSKDSKEEKAEKEMSEKHQTSKSLDF